MSRVGDKRKDGTGAEVNCEKGAAIGRDWFVDAAWPGKRTRERVKGQRSEKGSSDDNDSSDDGDERQCRVRAEQRWRMKDDGVQVGVERERYRRETRDQQKETQRGAALGCVWVVCVALLLCCAVCRFGVLCSAVPCVAVQARVC